MKLSVLSTLLFALIFCTGISANNTIHGERDPHDVRFVEAGQLELDMSFQKQIANSPAWSNYVDMHPGWKAFFDESNQKPSRAFGPAIAVQGMNPTDQALNFIDTELEAFNIPVENLELVTASDNGKSSTIIFQQKHEGAEVLFSRMMVKVNHQFGVTSWRAVVHQSIELGMTPALSGSVLELSASAGIEGVESSLSVGELAILPIPVHREYQQHLVQRVMVEGTANNGLPYRYNVLVDANTGDVLYRYNEIHTFCGHDHGEEEACPAEGEKKSEKDTEPSELMVASATITGDVWYTNPNDPMINLPFPNMRVSVIGSTFFTNQSGFVTTNAVGPVNVQVQMRGAYAQVFDGTTTPSFTVQLAEGANEVDVTGQVSDEAVSGFINTNIIHDYMKTVIPSFTALDTELPVNIEITPHECNAFYNGSSINFYTAADECRSLVTVSDVVYHEYGHAINGQFYGTQGQSFQNGGMNEGYADVWAFAVQEDPLLGDGAYPQTPDVTIRRYDIDPKVYPADIVGEVHGDGEIIAGAWWDTYVLLGQDMDATMALFAGVYNGFQANTFNGNEGVAFLDVLLDCLEFDDDDGNILNGTPNGAAISEGFAIHGITFLATAEIDHEPISFIPGDEVIMIEGELDISNQFTDYLDGVNLYFKVNTSTVFTEVPMTDLGDNEYEAAIPAQENGTIVGYYMAVRDIFGNASSITPVAAHLEDPNLPNYIMVGYELEETYDSDDEEDITSWEEGVPGDDATTGEWEEAFPQGTFSDSGVAVAPDSQSTPDGEFCFVTGNDSDPTAIGQNDVDAGTTTLMSEEIDLTDYNEPAFSYMRWYTNSPPGGANPGADWWQVQVSDDGGDSWVYVENTLTSDASWRKYVFRVTDYVDVTDEFMIKFNASDSTTVGENLDGGSLIEAALDDFQIWSTVMPDGLDELIDNESISLYPNPTDDELTVEFDLTAAEALDVMVFDVNGRVVLTDRISANTGRVLWSTDVSTLAKGAYSLELSSPAYGKLAMPFVKN